MRRQVRRLRSEDGNVLVIAVMMMTLMLVLGSSALSVVDTQTDVVKKERQHESTFNLAEGVLHAQTYVLARLGTGSSSQPFPELCDDASSDPLCPADEDLTRSFDPAVQNDYAVDTWNTQVRDNPDGDFYSEAGFAAAARYDANDDKQLWVRSNATVRGRIRTIVALIKVEFRAVAFPKYALAGGWFQTSNNGRKTILDATGSLGVAVRCVEDEPSTQSTCLGYDPNKDQLEPAGHYQTEYPATATGVLSGELQDLEDFARANGTYYEGCPVNAGGQSDPNGQVVVVENGNCSFTNSSAAAPGQSTCCNSAADPGVFIMKCGTVSLSGNIEFYGIIYVPNQCGLTGTVVETQGTALISGGVIIDGGGGMVAGSSGMNLQFDPWAFDSVSVAGTAGVVQNTWREIPDDD